MPLNDSAELLSRIRLRGSIPDNSPDWTDSLVLRQATDEMLEAHLPLLVRARGEYLVKTVDLPVVGGIASYRLPSRCAAVRYVGFLQADGRLTEIPEATPTELAKMEVNVRQVGRPSRYTFREHQVELWPIPGGSSDSLRVRYHIRPSRIVPTTNAAQITAITPNTPTAGITRLAFAANTATLFAAGPRFDLVKVDSPFDIMAFDLLPSGSTTTTREFASASIPADLAVGDYVTPAGYSPVPNIPVELHPSLALRAGAAIISPKGDGLAADMRAEADDKEKALLSGILAPRSKGNAKILISRRWG